MRVEEVSSKAQEKAFLKVHHLLYKNDPDYVCPLDQDIEVVFNRGSNPFFKEGDAKRWLLYDERGERGIRFGARRRGS